MAPSSSVRDLSEILSSVQVHHHRKIQRVKQASEAPKPTWRSVVVEASILATISRGALVNLYISFLSKNSRTLHSSPMIIKHVKGNVAVIGDDLMRKVYKLVIDGTENDP